MSLAPRVDLIENQVAVIQSADANKTLTSTDKRRQIFTGPTTSRDCTLPTTGIVAGETWTIENTSAFDLVIKSSNGSALTIANGANIDATMRNGYARLVALVATPTTPAHWRVAQVEERCELTSVMNSMNVTAPAVTYKISRKNSTVTVTQKTYVTSASKNNTSDPTPNAFLATRHCPVDFTIYSNHMYTNDAGTTLQLGILYIGTGGDINYSKNIYGAAWALAGTTLYPFTITYVNN